MDLLTLLVLSLLIVKHFIADFILQSPFPYLYENKGKFGHPGGLLHASIHILLSLPFAIYFNIYWILGVEAVVHYFMDLIKVQLNERLNLKPESDILYWILLGFDQMIHYLTYAFMLYLWV